MEKKIRDNIFTKRMTIGLQAAIMGWTIIEYFSTGKLSMFIWSLAMFLVYVPIITIITKRFPTAYWIRYFMCGFYAITYTGLFWLTGYQSVIGFAFAATCVIIVYCDIKYTIFTILGVLVVVGGISIIKLKGNPQSLLEMVMCLYTTLCYIIVCFLTNRRVTVNAKRDEEAIRAHEETKKQQIDFLKDASRQLETNISEVNKLTYDLKSQMDISKEAVEQISGSSLDTATSIQQQLEYTDNIQENIKKIQNMASETIDDVSTVVDMTKAGEKIMTTLSSNTESMVKQSQEIASNMKELGEKASGIRSITDAIQGISQQTNLLALNASIEAARAGEAGRGFSVVADEIRALSESTNEFTGQIEQVLGDVLKALEMMVKATQDSSAKMIEDETTMKQAKESFMDIAKYLSNTYARVGELGKQCNDLAEANSGIVEHISNLSAMSEEVTSQSERTVEVQNTSVKACGQIAEAMDELLKTAQKLVQ